MGGLQQTPACPSTMTIWASGGAFHPSLLHTELSVWGQLPFCMFSAARDVFCWSWSYSSRGSKTRRRLSCYYSKTGKTQATRIRILNHKSGAWLRKSTLRAIWKLQLRLKHYVTILFSHHHNWGFALLGAKAEQLLSKAKYDYFSAAAMQMWAGRSSLHPWMHPLGIGQVPQGGFRFGTAKHRAKTFREIRLHWVWPLNRFKLSRSHWNLSYPHLY